MSTPRQKKASAKYRTITQKRTQRETAEAIYQYLLDHPADIPTSAAYSGELTFVLDNGPACVRINDYNGLNLTAFPATTTSIQTERGWASNSLGTGRSKLARGAIIDHPHNTHRTPDVEESIRFIRLVISRTLRHHAKEQARVAAQIERREASPDTGPGVPLVPTTAAR